MAIFRSEEEAKVREFLARLERPVELVVALGPDEGPVPGAPPDLDFGAETVRVVEELCALSGLLSFRVEEEPDGVDRFPAVLVRPEGEEVGVHYYGLPWGYEVGSLVGAAIEAGKREPSLQPESLEALAGLDRDLAIEVFVTPT